MKLSNEIKDIFKRFIDKHEFDIPRFEIIDLCCKVIEKVEKREKQDDKKL